MSHRNQPNKPKLVLLSAITFIVRVIKAVVHKEQGSYKGGFGIQRMSRHFKDGTQINILVHK